MTLIVWVWWPRECVAHIHYPYLMNDWVSVLVSPMQALGFVACIVCLGVGRDTNAGWRLSCSSFALAAWMRVFSIGDLRRTSPCGSRRMPRGARPGAGLGCALAKAWSHPLGRLVAKWIHRWFPQQTKEKITARKWPTKWPGGCISLAV